MYGLFRRWGISLVARLSCRYCWHHEGRCRHSHRGPDPTLPAPSSSSKSSSLPAPSPQEVRGPDLWLSKTKGTSAPFFFSFSLSPIDNFRGLRTCRLHTHTYSPRRLAPALAHASSLDTHRTRNARAPTSTRITGFCAMWAHISPSSSSTAQSPSATVYGANAAFHNQAPRVIPDLT